MTDTLHIAQVAERAGVSPATIRYYERIGVLPRPQRATNGYRVYRGDTVDRLRFVARAKALGCTLEEITDLVLAWAGGECGPVQNRLRTLVGSKIDDTRSGIVELVAFLAELQRAAAGLDGPPVAGPCDDSCGCLRDPHDGSGDTTCRSPAGSPDEPFPAGHPDQSLPAGPVPIELVARRRPASGQGDPAIACSLPADRVAGRMGDWGRVLAGTASAPIPGGVRVALAPETDLGAVAALAAAEWDCCRFFAFRVTIDDRGAGLEVTGPVEAVDVIHAAFGAGW